MSFPLQSHGVCAKTSKTINFSLIMSYALSVDEYNQTFDYKTTESSYREELIKKKYDSTVWSRQIYR
jgi:hypothetical protein